MRTQGPDRVAYRGGQSRRSCSFCSTPAPRFNVVRRPRLALEDGRAMTSLAHDRNILLAACYARLWSEVSRRGLDRGEAWSLSQSRRAQRAPALDDPRAQGLASRLGL